MAELVDTSIRLLGQEPLAGRVPTAELLRLAEILDGAGFAYLEVSGGGCFDSAVRRGVESPWERIRALKARTTTPLGLALRGRFLVGARPVEGELVRRFIASASENGIDVFRLHDPLNDVSNLREAAEAIAIAGREFEAGLVYSPGLAGETESLVAQARELPELGAARVLLHDPTGSLQPHRASELVQRLGEASGLPIGVYFQGASGQALASALEAARAGADVLACAVYPLALTLHRVSGEALAQALAGLVAALDTHLRANAAGDRLDEVLEELGRIREEVGSPPLAAPTGQILASQALLHVLSASRYVAFVDELRELVRGEHGRPPGPIDPAVERAVGLLTDADEEPQPPVRLSELRTEAEGLAASEEELLLLGLFGEDAEPLLHTIRGRMERADSLGGRSADQARSERIRDVVRIVQESGVAEVTLDEGDMRISVRRTDDRVALPQAAPVDLSGEEFAAAPAELPSNGLVRIESPMVGTFYRASEPGSPPFVQEGDPVTLGQTLCILEAMKLMNEVKAEVEGVVRAIHVPNAEPVEFGQLLFELEPLAGRPLDAV